MEVTSAPSTWGQPTRSHIVLRAPPPVAFCVTLRRPFTKLGFRLFLYITKAIRILELKKDVKNQTITLRTDRSLPFFTTWNLFPPTSSQTSKALSCGWQVCVFRTSATFKQHAHSRLRPDVDISIIDGPRVPDTILGTMIQLWI